MIAGQWKGLGIRTLKGEQLRPTSARVKESLFSIIGSRAVGTHLLDLYAGSGNIGIEALSRGAAKVVFMDRHPASIDLIVENLGSLGITYGFEIYKRDGIKGIGTLGRKGVLFDLIFIDPPYFRGLGEKSLNTIAESGILKTDGITVLKHHRKENASRVVQGLARTRVCDYGDTLLSFYSATSDCIGHRATGHSHLNDRGKT